MSCGGGSEPVGHCAPDSSWRTATGAANLGPMLVDAAPALALNSGITLHARTIFSSSDFSSSPAVTRRPPHGLARTPRREAREGAAHALFHRGNRMESGLMQAREAPVHALPRASNLVRARSREAREASFQALLYPSNRMEYGLTQARETFIHGLLYASGLLRTR